ncbi:MAG: hypothetical protein ACYDEY_11465 [Acidimicrobiales bacterium]
MYDIGVWISEKPPYTFSNSVYPRSDLSFDTDNRNGAIRCLVGAPGYLVVKVELPFMRRHARVEPNTTCGSTPRFLDEERTGCGLESTHGSCSPVPNARLA